MSEQAAINLIPGLVALLPVPITAVIEIARPGGSVRWRLFQHTVLCIWFVAVALVVGALLPTT